MNKTFTQIPNPKLLAVEPSPSAEVIAAFEKRAVRDRTHKTIFQQMWLKKPYGRTAGATCESG